MGRSCKVYRDNQNLPTGPLADGSWSARKNTWLIKREKCLDWIHKVFSKNLIYVLTKNRLQKSGKLLSYTELHKSFHFVGFRAIITDWREIYIID